MVLFLVALMWMMGSSAKRTPLNVLFGVSSSGNISSFPLKSKSTLIEPRSPSAPSSLFGTDRNIFVRSSTSLPWIGLRWKLRRFSTRKGEQRDDRTHPESRKPFSTVKERQLLSRIPPNLPIIVAATVTKQNLDGAITRETPFHFEHWFNNETRLASKGSYIGGESSQCQFLWGTSKTVKLYVANNKLLLDCG